MVRGDCLVAATGVTDGPLLKGVRFGREVVETDTVLMRSATGTVRRIFTEHRELGNALAPESGGGNSLRARPALQELAVMEDLLLRLATALAIGLVVGVERGWQTRTQPDGSRTAGVRTFALSSLAGGVFAALGQEVGSPVVLVAGL
eukprot:gene20376-24978_t